MTSRATHLSVAKRIGAVLIIAIALLLVVARIAEVPREAWLPLLIACLVFIPIHTVMKRRMRGRLSTALAGAFLGATACALTIFAFGIPKDWLLLLIVGALYGVLVTFIYEGERLDVACGDVAQEQVPSNPSLSGRDVSATGAAGRRSTGR